MAARGGGRGAGGLLQELDAESAWVEEYVGNRLPPTQARMEDDSSFGSDAVGSEGVLGGQ